MEKTRTVPVFSLMNCKYFGQCGGCFYGDMPYQEEILLKKKRLDGIFREIETEKLKFIPALREYGCRNRMEFSVKDGKIGQHKKNSFREIVDIEECLMLSGKANAALKKIRENIFSAGLAGNDFLRYITIRETVSPPGIYAGATVSDRSSSRLEALKKALSDSGITGYYLIENASLSNVSPGELFEQSLNMNLDMRSASMCRSGTATRDNPLTLSRLLSGSDDFIKEELATGLELSETVNGRRFFFGPQSFFQTNSVMLPVFAGTIASLVEAELKRERALTLFDIFSGVGLLGISLAGSFREVFMIENSIEASEFASKNASCIGLKNCHFIAGDAYRVLRKKAGEYSRVNDSFFIFDPPRSGLQKIVKFLMNNDIERFLYISCNPKVMQREIELLSGKYKTERVIAVDMFPRTGFFETIALMSLK